MKNKDKIMIGGLAIVLIFIFVNIFSTLHTMYDYEGLQVENRILQTEEKVNRLEEDIEQWKH